MLELMETPKMKILTQLLPGTPFQQALCQHCVNTRYNGPGNVSAMGGEWAERQHPLGGCKWLLFKVAACHKWGPQGIDIRLLNIFISDLEDGIMYPCKVFPWSQTE